MGWDPESSSLRPLSDSQAAGYVRGPVFAEGEEVVLKGVTFIVSDIAPGQIKLKPKKASPQELAEFREKMAELERLAATK